MKRNFYNFCALPERTQPAQRRQAHPQHTSTQSDEMRMNRLHSTQKNAAAKLRHFSKP